MPAPTIFRFPGSKAKFLKTLTPFLDRLLQGRKRFHDVFTGGGAVALFSTPAELKAALGVADATFDDVFIHYTGGMGEAEGAFRETSQARRIMKRLG